ncbi:hypothetical protein [Polaribacter sp. SA4-12]|uniref:hypothetical protein n=1 Tax=Polaribacter sp. SA4-12 TaxID=1312072 RepID=UPI000B3CC6AE|nr:hypothetical protein [Polaribacter sp. SA4-12]ARV15023.1 hypothetical protein BTO07_07605 [Polaribacter sp. SA4-12]
MRNQYLTKKRKEWYLVDFNNLLNIENPTWKIDSEELKKILIKINSNEYIQTLYSKQKLSKSELHDTTSYIEFTYNSRIELKLFREILCYFIEEYNYDRNGIQSICYFEFNLPKENPNYKKNSPQIGLKCTDDNDYFKINHIKLHINSMFQKVHIDFWNDLTLKINGLKP